MKLKSHLILSRIARASVNREREMGERVCVTGAGGYVASWLIKFLLSKGYSVNGTVRDPAADKNAHLLKLDKAAENLQLIKANLLDYDSLAAAISGCRGVFHVASPVPSSKVPNPEVDLIQPAVMGTINVLKACSEAGVKRVIVVSSVAALSMNPNWPKDKVMDEDCWSDEQYCKTTENFYCLSKTMAEREALRYAKKNNLDVVTVCPSIILGPLLQPTINSSILVLLKLLTGVNQTMENRTRIFVDVRDVADALLLTYEKPEASGRYVCAPHVINIRVLVNKLKSMYPGYKYPENIIDADDDTKISSEKLERLGWKYRPLEESLVDTVEYFQKAGLLNKD